MHALEKLWKAAYVFHAEGSLEADLWVLDRTLRILFGEVGQVVKGIRHSITKRALAGPKRKTLNAVAVYLYRNRAHMRYDEYLANGWPMPVALSKARAKTSSKTAWSVPVCAGPSKWPRRSSNSAPSTSQETSMPIGNFTSNRTSTASTPPGPWFQSSHTQLIK